MTLRAPRKTRERLLQTAFQEMLAHGFQGMRVDEVLRASGLQKGAFYHHFSSKTELGYAVLDEQIKPLIEKIWLEPLANIEDPVLDFPLMLDSIGDRIPPAMQQHGCPLNNLALEMASQDEEFRERVAKLFNHWIDAFQAIFDKGKKSGHIRGDVDSRAVARFMIAALEGCIGLLKVDQSAEQWTSCRFQIAHYLETLRPDFASARFSCS